MSSDSITISWYGRCCFLVEYQRKKILFDPYDSYCNVNIGTIDADILISSSTWHDHGHIGASPNAHIYTYPGQEENGDFLITGIEAKEDRGTPTVIFNVQFGSFSITNFADFGPQQKDHFEKNLTKEQRDILRNTNIVFMRPSIKGDEVREENIHNEIALNYCQPNIIFPEHYFPESFSKSQIPLSMRHKFLRPLIVVDEMIKNFGFPVKKINAWRIDISKNDLVDTKIYKFLKLHEQVVYLNENSSK